MKVQIDHYIHSVDGEASLRARVILLEGRVERLMAFADDMRALKARQEAVNTRTAAAFTNIAADIRRLKDRIEALIAAANGAISQAEADALEAEFTAVVVAAEAGASAGEAVANDPDNPDPAPTV